jgi:hypothetical protein
MTKIILASDLLAAGLNKTKIAKRLGVSRWDRSCFLACG